MPKRYAPVLSEMETLTVPYVVSATFDSAGNQLSYSPTDSVTIRNQSNASMFLKIGNSDWREIKGGQSRLAPIDMETVPVWVKRGRDAPLIACLLEMVGKPAGIVVRATTVAPIAGTATAGQTGPMGPAGPKGDKGDQGIQGAMGPIGPEGPRGLQGFAGPQGASGENGSVGPQGPQGASGATGATGAAGSVGGQGPQGPSGTAGATGSQGPIGLTGPAGIQGLKGDKGDTGNAGAQGIQGPAGPTGNTGPQGIQGATGPAGGGLRVALASDVINANAVANTIADVTTLAFSVVANTRYKFRFVIVYTSAAATTGSRWTINGPAATELVYRSEYTLTAASRTVNDGLTAYNLPAASNASSLVSGNIAIIEGVIRPSVNGSVIARFASEILSSAITAKAGMSYVDYEVLG